MARKKSFADELNELLTPGPAAEFDPERDLVEEPVVNHEDIEPYHQIATSSRPVQEKGLLFRSDVVMDDDAYRGKKTTRAALFGADASEALHEQDDAVAAHEDDSEQDEDEDSLPAANGYLSSSDDEAAQQDNDAQVQQLLNRIQSGGHASSSDGEEEDRRPMARDQSPLSDEDAEDRAHRPSGARPARGGDEVDALEAEWQALEQEEEAAMATMRQQSDKEVTKGLAVRNQQKLYERALELRILLQKPLTESLRLPRPSAFSAALAAREELQGACDGLRKAALGALSSLLEFQGALMDRNPAIQPAAVEAANGDAHRKGRKRHQPDATTELWDLDSAWAALEASHQRLGPFCDESLDRWHRRTVLSSGSAALRNNLRALNQSISSQVAAIMRDPSKFIKRTRLTVSAAPPPLCTPAPRRQPGDGQPASGGSRLDSMEEVDEEHDPETFNDGEFYQQLLKEFLDTGNGGLARAGVKAVKKRKNVDRRASKGRKIRYHVHDKLVNFATPVEFEPPPFAAQLFANLFGHQGR